MRILLTFCIVLTVSVAMSNAACQRGKPHMNLKTRTIGCMYKGTYHKLNTEWTDECEDCTCSKNGLECCDRAFEPLGFDTEVCQSVLDKESCTYIVTRKDDPSIPCLVKSMKG